MSVAALDLALADCAKQQRQRSVLLHRRRAARRRLRRQRSEEESAPSGRFGQRWQRTENRERERKLASGTIPGGTEHPKQVKICEKMGTGTTLLVALAIAVGIAVMAVMLATLNVTWIW